PGRGWLRARMGQRRKRNSLPRQSFAHDLRRSYYARRQRGTGQAANSVSHLPGWPRNIRCHRRRTAVSAHAIPTTKFIQFDGRRELDVGAEEIEPGFPTQRIKMASTIPNAATPNVRKAT